MPRGNPAAASPAAAQQANIAHVALRISEQGSDVDAAWLRAQTDGVVQDALGEWLVSAVRAGREDLCAVLLDAGADVNHAWTGGLRPLHLAVGNARILALLLDRGAQVAVRDDNGMSPVAYAAGQGQLESLCRLIDAGGDVDGGTSDGRMFPLQLAVQEGHRSVVAYLIARGASVSARAANGTTALHFAAHFNSLKCARLLVAAGAEVDATSSDGLTPLHIAAAKGHTAMVEMLLGDSAEIDVRELREEQTPLHLSASGGHVACSRLLLEREAPVNARDRSGRTPLHVAVQQARGGIVALLIEYGCDVDAADCEGRTPLHYAAALGHGGCAGALVNAECDLSARDSAGLSPAHVAARAGHAAVLSVFLDARPEEAVARDERGKTPLHYAAAAARATCVRLLVDRKADISERDDEGRTPLDLAPALSAPHDAAVAEVRLLLGDASAEEEEAPTADTAAPPSVRGNDAHSSDSRTAPSVADTQSLGARMAAVSLSEGSEKPAPKKKKKARSKAKRASGGSPASPAVARAAERNGGAPSDTLRSEDPARGRAVSASGVFSIGKIRYDRDKVLGYGSHGTIVFDGFYDARRAAVKRMLREFTTLAAKEVAMLSLLSESESHPNILRYYGREEDAEYIYLAVELCVGPLSAVYDEPQDAEIAARTALLRRLCNSPHGTEFAKKLARQLLEGLRFLHSLNIVHNDIKPQNVLIGTSNSIKISDMGIAHRIVGDRTTFTFTHGRPDTGLYTAPEVLDTSGVKTKMVDIFAAGCVLYGLFTRGGHPFGGSFKAETEVNIRRGQYSIGALNAIDPEAADLVEWMLQHDPRQRPTCDEALAHPLFWTDEERLSLVEDMSEPPAEVLAALEARAGAIFGPSAEGAPLTWMPRIDRLVLEYASSHRQYNGASVMDLLRLLRNVHQHFKALPTAVARAVACDGGGDEERLRLAGANAGTRRSVVLGYFQRRFPALVIEVYRARRSSFV